MAVTLTPRPIAAAPPAVVRTAVVAPAAPTSISVGSTNFSTLKLTKPVTAIGSAAEIQANLDNLQKLAAGGKLTGIQLTDTGRSTVTFTAAQYKKDPLAFAKIKDVAATQVQFDGNASQYRVSANTNGTWTVTDTRVGGQGSTVVKGVNFLKFNDRTNFADSGDANVNALLSGGTNQWWHSGSAPNAVTSAALVKPGLNSLASSSVKTTLTYSFLANANQGDAGDKLNFQPMTATQKQAARDAMAYLASLINVQFVEDTANTGNADINFGTNDQSAQRSAGYANPPNASGGHAVYLMLNNAAGNTNGDMSRGSYGWETLVHELGHTLGLKHPGNYNAGGGGANAPYLPASSDVRRLSVMSYYDAPDSRVVNSRAVSGGTEYSVSTINPSTYMVYDIQALQFLYGANTSTTESTSAAFQKQTFDDNWKGFQTLWNPNGGTLDASAVSKANIVDLRSGAFSSVGILPDTAKTSLPTQVQKYQTYMGMNNVALASGSRIDTVKGGTGQDVVYTRADRSVTIDGGAGSDTVYLAGKAADWLADGAGGYTSVKDSNVKITLNNVEKIKFYDAAKVAMMHTALDLKV